MVQYLVRQWFGFSGYLLSILGIFILIRRHLYVESAVLPLCIQFLTLPSSFCWQVAWLIIECVCHEFKLLEEHSFQHRLPSCLAILTAPAQKYNLLAEQCRITVLCNRLYWFELQASGAVSVHGCACWLLPLGGCSSRLRWGKQQATRMVSKLNWGLVKLGQLDHVW